MIKKTTKNKRGLIVKKTYFFQHLCTLHHCTIVHINILYMLLLSVSCWCLNQSPVPCMCTYTSPVKPLLILIQSKETV